MAAPTPFNLSPAVEQSLLLYATTANNMLLNQFSLRSQLEEIDRYYMREGDYTAAQLRNRAASKAGDKSKMQDVTVPIVMPQVEAALGYMTNVFLTGYPIFGTVSDPSTADYAMQMETIIEENSVTAGWARQLLMFFRNGLKYNLHGIECDWDQKKVASIDTDITYPNNAKPTTTLWQGNCLKNMDLYNTFFDPRVHPAEIHSEGEFAGYIQLMSRIRMKKYFNDMYGIIPASTIIRALESNIGSSPSMGNSMAPFGYYVPLINPAPLMDKTAYQAFDWMAWAQNNQNSRRTISYSNAYQVVKLYARIIPSDHGLKVPEANTPQVWKFIIVNGQVIAYAERCTNAHNFIPIFFGQPIEDGLDFQTKSFATNVTDMQDVASAMVNGYMASKRRLVGDRVLYDPMRVREKDINSTNPAAKIPVRPSAYGKNVADSVYQFPYRDEATNSLIQGSSQMVGYANVINGQNPAQQGQFVKGNKTLHEYEDTMGHGNNRNQIMGLTTENQVFAPMKEVIKLNILQYQTDAVIFSRSNQKNVTINSTDLRKAAIHFRMVDGMLPADKLLSADDLSSALQALTQSPQLGAGYNLAPMFSYLFKERGADLKPFEKSPLQQAYEQQIGVWQQTAIAVAKQGGTFNTPQPQMPPELIAELKNGRGPDPTGIALEATQGGPQPNGQTAQQLAPNTPSANAGAVAYSQPAAGAQ